MNTFCSKLDRSFIVLSALLLCIWPLQGTIALRNILLGLGLVAAILWWLRCRHTVTLKGSRADWLPLIGIDLLLLWVVVHYLFIGADAQAQWSELKGTWLRVLMACAIGIITGLVLQRQISQLSLLWLGIGASFTYLFGDYLLVALNQGTLFMPSYYFSSPFLNKINVVMMGSILVGACAGWIAHYLGSRSVHRTLTPVFIWGVAMVLVLFSYTTIVDTRNGLGVATLVFGLLLGITVLRHARSLRSLVVIGLVVVLMGLFIQQHLKINRGWAHFFDDLAVAVQIDQYPHWQDAKKFGYPTNASGQTVYPNNYERAAWATVGLQTIADHPLGYGLLEHSLEKQVVKKYPDAVIESSHSAWIDFGLAFGIPGLAIVLLTLASLILLGIRTPNLAGATVTWIAISIVISYTVAEASSKHSIEVLFFMMALLSGLLIPQRPVHH